MKKTICIIVIFSMLVLGGCKVYTCPTYALNNIKLKSKDKNLISNMEEETQDKQEEKVMSLAEQVAAVEQEVAQAMIDAVAPILEHNGFTGFKDIHLMTTKPDKDGNVQQTIKVLL